MASDKAFLACMADLEVNFGAQPTARHKMLKERFKATPDEDFLAAVLRCNDELRAFPTVRDILDRLPGHLDQNAAAATAWSNVWSAVVNGPFTAYNPAGGGNRPTGSNLTELEFHAVGGRSGLRSLFDVQEDAEQVGFRRRDFIDAFKAGAQCWSAGLTLSGAPALPEGRVVVKALPVPVEAVAEAKHKVPFAPIGFTVPKAAKPILPRIDDTTFEEKKAAALRLVQEIKP